jgi:long-chain acyl-CoA synthetase
VQQAENTVAAARVPHAGRVPPITPISSVPWHGSRALGDRIIPRNVIAARFTAGRPATAWFDAGAAAGNEVGHEAGHEAGHETGHETGFKAGKDGVTAGIAAPPRIHEEKPLAESLSLQNRRGTRYLLFDDAATIAEVFSLRCRTSPNAPAYREFDSATKEWYGIDWREAGERAARMREGLRREGLNPGERIAVMLKNSINWVVVDQGAFAHGLVTVPVFVDDRPDNVAFILNDAGVKLIVIDGEEHWKRLKAVRDQLGGLLRILTVKPVNDPDEPRLALLSDWMPKQAGTHERPPSHAGELATIVYTSGTTGRPKGVMLSHRNILANVQSGLAVYDVFPDDVFLSFLPLSHMFERTADYYLNVVSGASIVFSRSIPQLAEDFRIVQPTIIFSVPRIYERFLAAINDQLKKSSAAKRKLFALAVAVGWSRFEYQHGRGPWQASFLLWPILKKLVAEKLLARMGGKLRFAVAGGAALSTAVSKVFVGLGLPICQGYGLSEASPLLAVNLLDKNEPSSVGPAVPGVETRIGENSVLFARGQNIMMGYWNNPEATRAVLSDDGWLNTGDQVRVDEHGFIHITGRIKEIIVMGNGEKVPPVDMELAIQMDPLFEQVLVYGEGKPYLSAIVVLNDEEWARIAIEAGVDPQGGGEEIGKGKAEKLLVQRIGKLTKDFPGYAGVRKVTIAREKWTIDNGLITPTLKLRRQAIFKKYALAIEEMYKGHLL